MATIITTAVYATFDGVPSNTPGWDLLNPMELAAPAPRRGTDATLIPGAHGRLPNRMRRDSAVRVLTWAVHGWLDHEGAAFLTPREGLEVNVGYLSDHVYAIPAGDDSTRTCVLYLPSGGQLSGLVQVQDFQVDWGAGDDGEATVAMKVLLPAGQLEAVSSS